MAITSRVPHEQLAHCFASFTKRFLRDGSPEAIDVEVIEPELGSQLAMHGVRLLGVTYDPSTDELDFAVETGDHRIYSPGEVWVIEERDGFISAVGVIRTDGTREVVSVRRVGLRHFH